MIKPLVYRPIGLISLGLFLSLLNRPIQPAWANPRGLSAAGNPVPEVIQSPSEPEATPSPSSEAPPPPSLAPGSPNTQSLQVHDPEFPDSTLPEVPIESPPPPSTPPAPAVPQSPMEKLKASGDRWLEINLASQRLIAWEGGTPVYAVIVSTGKASTPTRTGLFAIQSKHREARMQGADYDVPDVPYTMYYSGGYAIHGAYWHNRFGTPVSHGCVNVAVNHAKWFFEWASLNTPVYVH